jgi:hypothetical protein
MNKRDETFLQRIQAKLNCTLSSCINDIAFTVAENEQNKAESKDRVYIGLCSKCHKSFKLKGQAFNNFQRVIGQTKLAVVQSTFDDLFE